MEIGDKKIIYSASLIVPDGESASVSFVLGSWVARMRIEFGGDTSKDGKSTINVKGEDPTTGESTITFLNWRNPIGTATTKPINIGKTNTNQDIFVLATHWYIGSVNKLDIQFLLGK